MTTNHTRGKINTMRLVRTVSTAAAIGLGLALSVAAPALAQPNCDVPKPPPICNRGDPDGLAPALWSIGR